MNDSYDRFKDQQVPYDSAIKELSLYNSRDNSLPFDYISQ